MHEIKNHIEQSRKVIECLNSETNKYTVYPDKLKGKKIHGGIHGIVMVVKYES